MTANPASATAPRLTEKSTKTDILAAYRELLEERERESGRSPEIQAKRAEEQHIAQTAGQLSVEKILDGAVTLERQLRDALEDLRDKMTTEAGKLRTLQQAIAVEERHLQELYNIKASVHSLQALADTHQYKQRELEDEIRNKREAWAREQEQHEYETSQKRKRDEDTYRLKREAQEREIAERQQALKEQEEEFKDLRERAARFDAEMAQVIQRTREESEGKIRQEEQSRAALLAEQVLREKEIAKLKISSLEHRMEEQRAEIISLKDQLQNANREAKEIAVKVIEGASASATLQNLRHIQAAEHVRPVAGRAE